LARSSGKTGQDHKENKRKRLWIMAAPPKFDLRISPDEMQVLLAWNPEACSLEEVMDHLPELWKDLGISVKPDWPDIQERLKAASQTRGRVSAGESLSLVLAIGQPPQPSIHGKIEWQGPYFKKGYYIDATTRAVDYRRHAAQSSVKTNQLLAILHAAVEGQPGKTVRGKTIPVAAARQAWLVAGNNVHKNEAGDQFFASVDGRVRLEGDYVHVDAVLRIAGDVDLKSGNIDHPGAVEVEGHVRQGSSIRATGSVTVGGEIHNADIVCGGDLIVGDGLLGAKCRVRVAGALQARIINLADIECEGDMVVEKEIDNPRIRCRGSVTVRDGRIFGGETTALAGIFAREVGSHSQGTTVLSAGLDYALAKRLAQQTGQIHACDLEMQAVEERRDRYSDREKGLTAKERVAATELEFELEELKERKRALEQEASAILADSKQRSLPNIEVRDVLFRGVTLRLGDCEAMVNRDVKGPLRALPREGKIALVPFNPAPKAGGATKDKK
jgi:hypothetical protein